MTYFSKFPIINYNDLNMVDISKRIAFRDKLLKRLDFFEEIQLEDGETVESVAYDWYYNSQHAWLVMIVNDVIDPIYDWLLSQEELNRYIADKYDNINAVAYYVHEGVKYKSVADLPVPPSNDLVSIHTVTDYETELNELKRYIKIIKPEYRNIVINEFEELMSS